jgi:hypothetical protein
LLASTDAPAATYPPGPDLIHPTTTGIASADPPPELGRDVELWSAPDNEIPISLTNSGESPESLSFFDQPPDLDPIDRYPANPAEFVVPNTITPPQNHPDLLVRIEQLEADADDDHTEEMFTRLTEPGLLARFVERLYPVVRARLRSELLIDRERRGALADLR